MARIMVTGGLGFIGSHTVVELQQNGHEVVVVDDLSNSSREVLSGIEAITGMQPIFEEHNLLDREKVKNIFRRHGTIDGVIHFAAFKAVGESVQKPLEYYENNLISLINLLRVMQEFQLDNFIFSSSCTVYGQADKLPITEDTPVKEALSPYGNTKQIGEEILRDFTRMRDFHVIALRYFNPIGAHPSAHIGELPLGTPLNLVPFVTQTAIGLRDQLSVYGKDYDTRDGTCIRDYIHVVDLARAHVIALEQLLKNNFEEKFEVFNLGSGTGSTVLEVIKAFEEVSGEKLNYRIAARRSGDVTAAYADAEKAKRILEWKPEYSLKDAVADAWRWEKKIHQSR